MNKIFIGRPSDIKVKILKKELDKISVLSIVSDGEKLHKLLERRYLKYE